MKILCETTGPFMLVDYADGQTIDSTRPAVVTNTAFVNQRAMIGQLRKLADLIDEATDEEFARYVRDSEDIELAVEAFIAAFGVEKPTEKRTAKSTPAAPAAPKKGKAKADAQAAPAAPEAQIEG